MEHIKSQLYCACNERNIEKIKSILISCNKIDEEAYFLVCSNGDIEILELILQNSIKNNKLNIHTNNEYALKIACKYNKLDVLDYLIKFGELNKNRFCIYLKQDELLKLLCEYNNSIIFKYLLEYDNKYGKLFNFHLNNTDLLSWIIKSNNIELLKYMIEYIEFNNEFISEYTQQYIFQIACSCNYLDIVKYLYYKYTIDIYKYNIYFRDSCIIDKTDVIGFLLTCDDKHFSIYMYITMLEMACYYGNINIVKFLITYSHEKQLDYDITHYNELLFTNACKSGNIELIKILTTHLSYTSCINYEHLYYVYYSGKYDAIEYILNIVDVNTIRYDTYYKLLYAACCSNNIEIVKLLTFHKLYDETINNNYIINILNYICSNGYFKIFNFLCNDISKTNSTIISSHLYFLLYKAFTGTNLDLINFLLHFNEQETNKILNKKTEHTPLMYYIRHKELLQCYIEYCFYYNINVDLYNTNTTNYSFTHNSPNDYDLIVYLIYLSKHNYNKYNHISFEYDYEDSPIYSKCFMASQIYYPELVSIQKYTINIRTYHIKYIKHKTCTHSHIIIINNNLICLHCYGKYNFINNYTIIFI